MIAVESIADDVHPALGRFLGPQRVVVAADLCLPAALVVTRAHRPGHGRPSGPKWVRLDQACRLRNQILGDGDQQPVGSVDVDHTRRQLGESWRGRIGQQRPVGAQDAGVPDPGGVRHGLGVHAQCDGRVPPAIPHTLTGEAVTTDLQHAAGEDHELA
ncbi:Uncharacterised protein [Mycobacteroides abscessus subsp. massiliense]|nr:Uncharacterised protein [Mycobacteroides abscessus subsp. massiliense]